jgi:hypothetical protein
MAGDWIKMRLDLQTHPKIVRILSATKADKFRVIGGLHAVWSVFDTHSTDGTLPGYTPDTLDHIIGWIGFSEAMILVGWLTFEGPETLILPSFDEHNGKSGKRRAEDQRRKRDDRKNPQSVQIECGQIADKKRTREEKRREENTKPSASGSRLPQDWRPSEEDIEYFRKQCPERRIAPIAENFYDYWTAKPGAAGRKLDWSATWRTWVRKEAGDSGPGKVQGSNDDWLKGAI